MLRMSKKMVAPLIPHPALLIEENSERILVVADLHIGWEISLMEKGIHIPSQTWRMKERLLKIVEKCGPNRIIFLGDVKQSIPRISFEEWKAVPEFFEAIQKVVGEVWVTLGNHDGDLEPLTPRSVKIFPSIGLVVGRATRIGLFHGHAWPSPEVLASELLVMGHIHPVVRFRDKLGLRMVRQVWIKTICNGNKLAKAYLKYLGIKTDKNATETLKRMVGIELNDPGLIIMPAFNDLLAGVSVSKFRKHLMGPFFGSGSVNMADAEVYLTDGAYLGTAKQLSTYNSVDV
jgi:putative SbcD/Mre11-related phosphoesterase